MNKIKMGLIGCGRVSRKHIDALKLIPDVKLVAVCDIIEERAKKIAEEINCKYYINYKELLKDQEIDMVDVCTPTGTHVEIVQKIAEAKKNVICEKPMALRMIDAKTMVDTCKKVGVKLFIIKQNRYNLPIIKLKEALDNKKFGNLFFLNTTVRWSRDQNYYNQDRWRSEKNGGGGVILNQTVHHLDMLYYLGGEIESVYCIKKTFAHDIEVEDAHNFIANGILVHNSCTTMLYPCSILKGAGARSDSLGIAYAGKGQNQDTGAKVYHLAPNTSSTIKMKSISKDGGVCTYRGLVKVAKGAKNSRVAAVCDALILDKHSVSNTVPNMDIGEESVQISHEARVGKLSTEKIFYLMSRGLREEDAIQMIVSGFIEPVLKELPLEYAVELNKLIQLEMVGAVG